MRRDLSPHRRRPDVGATRASRSFAAPPRPCRSDACVAISSRRGDQAPRTSRRTRRSNIRNFASNIAILTVVSHRGIVHPVAMVMRGMSGQNALRRGRTSVPGQSYLVTTVVAARVPVFADCLLAGVVSQLHDSSQAFLDATGYCWVLMPDHWHAILQLGPERTLSEVVQRFKSLSASRVNQTSGTQGRLWQAGFHDHALRNERARAEACQYVIGNPVRAGLCCDPSAYPFWNTSYGRMAP